MNTPTVRKAWTETRSTPATRRVVVVDLKRGPVRLWTYAPRMTAR